MPLDIFDLASNRVGLRRLKLIEFLSDGMGRSGGEVMLRPLIDANEEYSQNFRILTEDLRWMLDRNWILWEESGGVQSGALPVSDGIQVAEEFKQARDNVALRIKNAQDSYLRWLCDAFYSESTRLTFQDFRESQYGHYLGTEFSDGDIKKAAKMLVDDGLMTGQWMTSGYYTNPRITSEGRKVIDRYGSVSNIPDPLRGGDMNFNFNDSHGNALSVNSKDVTQTTAVTISQVQEVTKFVKSARSLAQSLELEPESHSHLLEVIDAVEAEAATPAPKKNVLVELIGKTKELALMGAASGMVHVFGQVADVALVAIGAKPA